MNTRKFAIYTLFLSFIGISVLLLTRQNAIAARQEIAFDNLDTRSTLANVALEENNCRYGISGGSGISGWSEWFGAGWITNYIVAPNHLPVEAYVPTIRIGPSNDSWAFKIGSLASTKSNATQYPGRVWVVGNEVDVWSQDGMMPEIYAEAYHTIYTAIKSVDPTAMVSFASVSTITPGRLQYMELVMEAYRSIYGRVIPVDVWNIHAYNLAERGDGGIAVGTDPDLALFGPNLGHEFCSLDNVICRSEHDDADLFEKQIRDMRTWMKDNGHQDKSLLLTEWSVLYPYIVDNPGTSQESCYLSDENGQCFTPARINDYMDETTAFLESAVDPLTGNPHDNDKLVQQWMWFSLAYDPLKSGGSSSLLKDGWQDNYVIGDPAAMTEIGVNYKNKIAQSPLEVNLHAVNLFQAEGNSSSNSSSSTGTVSIRFNNNGSTAVVNPVSVTMYLDSALTNPIGTAVVNSNLLGCGVNMYEATINWSAPLAAGAHNFWVKIDSANSISETDESRLDNVLAGKVIVDAEHIYLPSVEK